MNHICIHIIYVYHEYMFIYNINIYEYLYEGKKLGVHTIFTWLEKPNLIVDIHFLLSSYIRVRNSLEIAGTWTNLTNYGPCALSLQGQKRLKWSCPSSLEDWYLQYTWTYVSILLHICLHQGDLTITICISPEDKIWDVLGPPPW